LLTEHPVTLENVPRIRDVETLVELIATLGVHVEWCGRNTLEITGKDGRIGESRPEAVPADPGVDSPRRAALARCGTSSFLRRAATSSAGGASTRTFLALERLGASFELRRQFHLSTPGLAAPTSSSTSRASPAPRTPLVAAVAARGTTILRNAASEPHVQDLCHFLVALGAEIDGIGTNKLTIEGGRRLGGTTHRIGRTTSRSARSSARRGHRVGDPDRRCRRRAPASTLMGFARLGSPARSTVPISSSRRCRSAPSSPTLGGHVPKLEDQPWPAFPADTMSIALSPATQCTGMVLIHEKMFESRLFFVDKLVGMGARIVLCDPHRALVAGPSRLAREHVDSPDIRAGMAMLLAALCAEGESTINNVGQIERGYERIDERLRELGAEDRARRRPPHPAHPTPLHVIEMSVIDRSEGRHRVA
jgi:UDP-N-acetylglucosamine 1-carboxyvinyltransferase